MGDQEAFSVRMYPLNKKDDFACNVPVVDLHVIMWQRQLLFTLLGVFTYSQAFVHAFNMTFWKYLIGAGSFFSVVWYCSSLICKVLSLFFFSCKLRVFALIFLGIANVFWQDARFVLRMDEVGRGSEPLTVDICRESFSFVPFNKTNETQIGSVNYTSKTITGVHALTSYLSFFPGDEITIKTLDNIPVPVRLFTKGMRVNTQGSCLNNTNLTIRKIAYNHIQETALEHVVYDSFLFYNQLKNDVFINNTFTNLNDTVAFLDQLEGVVGHYGYYPHYCLRQTLNLGYVLWGVNETMRSVFNFFGSFIEITGYFFNLLEDSTPERLV
jgi:hypothetical protein